MHNLFHGVASADTNIQKSLDILLGFKSICNHVVCPSGIESAIEEIIDVNRDIADNLDQELNNVSD